MPRRLLTAILLGIAATVPPTAQAGPRMDKACDRLYLDAIGHTIDYGLAQSTEGELAFAPDLDVSMLVKHCVPLSPRRVRFRYSIEIRNPETMLVQEHGTVIVTRQRATFQPI